MMAMRSATVSKCWRVRFMTVVSSRPTASSVEISRMRVASATESRASLYAFHPMKDVASVTMTLMGMIMRAISDIVSFSCSKPVGGRSPEGRRGGSREDTRGKGNVNYNPGGSVAGARDGRRIGAARGGEAVLLKGGVRAPGSPRRGAGETKAPKARLSGRTYPRVLRQPSKRS